MYFLTTTYAKIVQIPSLLAKNYIVLWEVTDALLDLRLGFW